MQQKLLETVIGNVGGKPAVEVLKILENAKNVNEFLIAKKLGLTINQVRNTLYQLSNHRLITFIRKKDNKKGWYTYYWTLNKKRCLEFLKQEIEKEKNELFNKLKSRETKRFYFCRTCVVDVSEETALSHDFTCQECGDVYELKDNSTMIKELKIFIDRKERQIKNVEDEIKLITEIDLKKRNIKDKRIKKQKSKEKRKRYEERKAEKMKLLKKKGGSKKKIKKKIKKKDKKKIKKKK
jgi:transcription factor E